MTRFFKAFFFIVASAIMAVCLLFVPETSGAVSVTYIAVLGLYLGLDVANMINKTANLPKGEYSKMNNYKYITTSICLGCLIAVSLYMKKKANIDTAMTSFISAIMVVIGCIIGGLEGNNIATDKGEDIKTVI